jgi:hypothetical protein
VILLLLALVFLAVPVYGAVRWILISTRVGLNQAEMVALFLRFLPEPLRDADVATWLFIVSALAAFGCAWFALKLVKTAVKLVVWLVIGVAGLLMMWNLFSLM